MSSWPACTSSPWRHLTAATVPSPGARTGSSIFMASRTSSTSPCWTRAPGLTTTWRTVAGIGAVSEPCAADARRRRANGRPVSNTKTSPSMNTQRVSPDDDCPREMRPPVVQANSSAGLPFGADEGPLDAHALRSRVNAMFSAEGVAEQQCPFAHVSGPNSRGASRGRRMAGRRRSIRARGSRTHGAAGDRRRGDGRGRGLRRRRQLGQAFVEK